MEKSTLSHAELILLKELISKQLVYYNELLEQKQRIAFNARSSLAFSLLEAKIDALLNLNEIA